MESHEVLRVAFKKPGCKSVAAELKLSLSLIHQWSRGNNGRSEALNPLDRVAQLLEVTGDRRLVDWLCARRNGYFVENVPVKNGKMDLPAAKMAALMELVEMESALLETMKQPKCPARAEQFDRRWELMKSKMEGLARSMRNGQHLMTWFVKSYWIYDVLTPGGLI